MSHGMVHRCLLFQTDFVHDYEKHILFNMYIYILSRLVFNLYPQYNRLDWIFARSYVCQLADCC